VKNAHTEMWSGEKEEKETSDSTSGKEALPNVLSLLFETGVPIEILRDLEGHKELIREPDCLESLRLRTLAPAETSSEVDGQ